MINDSKIQYSQTKTIKNQIRVKATYRGVIVGYYSSQSIAERLAPKKLELMKKGNTDTHILKIIKD